MKIIAHNNRPVERNNPRLSINSLSEYLTASAARRRRILEEQKRPRPFQAAYYSNAEKAITKYISSGLQQDELESARLSLLSTVPSKQWDLNRRASELEAILSAKKFARILDLGKYSVTEGLQRPARMNVAQVSISVRPEILLHEHARDGQSGAIKLYFSKTKKLSTDRARYITTIVYQYLLNRAAKNVKIGYKHCYVLDVFANELFRAPRTYQRRSKDIEASCDEISRLWSFV